MSHFLLHVFVPERAQIDSYLDTVLETYSEHLEVAPYLSRTIDEDELAEMKRESFAPTEYSDEADFLGQWFGGESVEYDHETGKWQIFSTYNPRSKWDWWVIGGRWSGFFHGKDIARVVEADWEGDKEDARIQANKTYDRFERATQGLPHVSWQACRDLHGEDVDTARKVYNDQEWVKAAREVIGGFIFDSPHEYFKVDDGGREAFVRGEVAGVGLPFAYIDLNGNWNGKGEMGWFGISHDEEDDLAWSEHYMCYLDRVTEMNPETRIVAVDCHI